MTCCRAIAFSRAAAAEASNISEDMLDRAIKAGELKAKQLGRRILIRPADLDAYIESLPDVEVKA
jgi:excisionase family DNA binding protein